MKVLENYGLNRSSQSVRCQEVWFAQTNLTFSMLLEHRPNLRNNEAHLLMIRKDNVTSGVRISRIMIR